MDIQIKYVNNYIISSYNYIPIYNPKLEMYWVGIGIKYSNNKNDVLWAGIISMPEHNMLDGICKNIKKRKKKRN